MKISSIGLLALALGINAGIVRLSAAVGVPVSGGTPGAELTLEHAVYDLGSVTEGDTPTANIKFTNTGSQDLVLTQIRPSCGCLVITFDKTTQPGQNGAIKTSLTTSNIRGLFNAWLTIVSNDSVKGEVKVFLKVKVEPVVKVLPNATVSFHTFLGSKDSQSLHVSSADNTFSPTITRVSATFLAATLSLASSTSTRDYVLAVSLLPSAPEGDLEEIVELATGIARFPKLSVTIYAVVKRRVEIFPARVEFGAVSSTLTRNVLLVNNQTGTQINVLKAELVGLPGFSVGSSVLQPGSYYVFSVKSPDQFGTGLFSGTLKLTTDDASIGAIQVPVVGEFRPVTKANIR